MKKGDWLCLLSVLTFLIVFTGLFTSGPRLFSSGVSVSSQTTIHSSLAPNGLYECQVRDENKLLRLDFRENGDVYLEVSTLKKGTVVRDSGAFSFRDQLHDNIRNDPQRINGVYDFKWRANNEGSLVIDGFSSSAFTFDGSDLLLGPMRFRKI